MDDAPSRSRSDLGSFELSAVDLCLDYVNTWGDRGRPDTDGLQTYAQLLAFARQACLMDPAEVAGLERQARADARAAAATTRAARDLREALYGIFSARAHGRAVPDRDLERLNEALGEALPNLRLDPQGTSLAWRWRHDRSALTRPVWPVARAAADLLTREPPALVRECEGSQCTWLFLDLSRGRSRRWCSMTSCGNREKARRHYHRVRKAAGEMRSD